MTPWPQEVPQMLVSAAEQWNRIVAVEKLNDDDSDEAVWVLHFEEGSHCVVEASSRPERLVLTGIIGAAKPGQDAKAQEAALQFNTLWDFSRGARIGLVPNERTFVLIQRVAPDDLTEHPLQSVIEKFEALRTCWELFLQADLDRPQRERTTTALLGLRA
jgi:Tir chaperone protein (CesT) family